MIGFDTVVGLSRAHHEDSFDSDLVTTQSLTPEKVLVTLIVIRTLSSLVFRFQIYRGTSLIRNRTSLGPYSRTIPRLLRRS